MPAKQVRQSSKDGRNALIKATLICLKEYGLHGTSVRRIAEKAKVTPGLLTHHFPGKEALIAEAYRVAANQALDAFMVRVEQSGDDPVKRLKAYIEASFEPENMDSELLKMWLGFWTLALSDQLAAEVQYETDLQHREKVSTLLTAVAYSSHCTLSEERIERLAIALSALLDGLWLSWCLNPDRNKLEQERRAALEMIEGALGISLEEDV